MYLMLKDKAILSFNFKNGDVDILNNELLPFMLRNKLVNSNNFESKFNNINLIKEYLSIRGINLNRDNAKNLYTAYELIQSNNINDRVKISIKVNGASITDSYWITDNLHEKYCKYNLRKIRFKELTNISLYGDNPLNSYYGITPELSTHGSFRKAWIRGKDNELYLLKSDRLSNNINTRMEVLSSKILEHIDFGIGKVRYTGKIRNGLYVSKCKNFVTDDLSFVTAEELVAYLGKEKFKYFIEYTGLGRIAVIDYIIANPDRHLQNYGFMFDNSSGELVKSSPIFDYNLALVSDYFNKNIEDTINPMLNTKDTLLELALRFNTKEIKIDKQSIKRLAYNNKEYKHIIENVLYRINKLSL